MITPIDTAARVHRGLPRIALRPESLRRPPVEESGDVVMSDMFAPFFMWRVTTSYCYRTYAEVDYFLHLRR
jgi:hypothetical protein